MTLDHEDVEAIARRVAELLGGQGTPAQPGPLLTAQQVAERLQVDRGSVYRMAEELGAVRVGTGPKAPLRFRAEDVERALTGRGAGEGSHPARSRAVGPSAAASRADVLPQSVESLPKEWRDALGDAA